VNYKLLWTDVKWQRHGLVKRAAAERRCPAHTHTHTNNEEW